MAKKYAAWGQRNDGHDPSSQLPVRNVLARETWLALPTNMIHLVPVRALDNGCRRGAYGRRGSQRECGRHWREILKSEC